MSRWGRDQAWRAAGLALLAGALGCGGKAESDPARPDPVPTASRRVPTAAPPSSSVAEPPRPAPAGPFAEPPPPPSRNVPFGSDDYGYFPVDAAENVLLANCRSCHGPDAPVAGSAGIRFIGDMDQLVAAGLIVPLDSAASPIIRVIVLGSMPPPSSGLPPMTEADIATIVFYVDNPRFWPGVSPPVAVDAGAALPAVDGGADGG